MSATGRGTIRQLDDFYVTPITTIWKFLNFFEVIEPSFTYANTFIDPCAGGTLSAPTMLYALMLQCKGVNKVITIDIRKESPATHHKDYLITKLKHAPYCVISNPPYSLAVEFITKALNDVQDGGYVIMLLRLNFFGSQLRTSWLRHNMPKYTFVHSTRPSFTGKGTDATEYAHFVWQCGYKTDHSKLFII